MKELVPADTLQQPSFPPGAAGGAPLHGGAAFPPGAYALASLEGRKPASLLDPRATLFVQALVEGRDFVEACKKAGCTAGEAVAWENIPGGAFLRMVESAKEEQNGAATRPGRIKLKAQAIVEDRLPAMDGLIGDDTLPPAARVSAFSAVKGLTGLDQPKDTGAVMPFRLNIVMPGSAGGGITIESGAIAGTEAVPQLGGLGAMREFAAPIAVDGEPAADAADTMEGGADWSKILP